MDQPEYNEIIELQGCELHLTCGACPEQYDVFRDGVQVGYIRLRHGSLTVDYGDCGGPSVYSAEPIGDGIFEDHEREMYLRASVAAIMAYHRK